MPGSRVNNFTPGPTIASSKRGICGRISNSLRQICITLLLSGRHRRRHTRSIKHAAPCQPASTRSIRDFSHGFAGLAQTLLCTMGSNEKNRTLAPQPRNGRVGRDFRYWFFNLADSRSRAALSPRFIISRVELEQCEGSSASPGKRGVAHHF